MKSPKTKTSKPAAVTRPYNRYNIFFILERENIILRKGGTTRWSTTSPNLPTSSENESALNLPPLPSRFRNLGYIPADWCIPGKAKRRPHRKTHGVATFRELAQSIAASWKTIDGETMEFCSTVEKALKQRQEIMMRDPKFVDHTNDQQQQSSKPSASNIQQQAKLKPKKQAKKKQIIKPKHVRSQKEQAPVKPKQVRSKQVATKPNPKPVTRQVASVSVSRSYDLIPSVSSNAAAAVRGSLPLPTPSAMAPQSAHIVQNFFFRGNNMLCKDDLSIQPIAATLDEDNLVCDTITAVPSNAAAPVGVSLPLRTPSAMAPQPAHVVQNFLFRNDNTLHKNDISMQPIATKWGEDNLFWDAREVAEMFGECDHGDDHRTVADESGSLVSSIQAPRLSMEQAFCDQQPLLSHNTVRPRDPYYNGTANNNNNNNDGINSMNSNLTSVGNQSNLSAVYTTLIRSNRGVPAVNVSDDDIRKMWDGNIDGKEIRYSDRKTALE